MSNKPETVEILDEDLNLDTHETASTDYLEDEYLGDGVYKTGGLADLL